MIVRNLQKSIVVENIWLVLWNSRFLETSTDDIIISIHQCIWESVKHSSLQQTKNEESQYCNLSNNSKTIICEWDY